MERSPGLAILSCRRITMLRLLLLVFIVLLLIGSLPAWPYSAHWGYYPSGGLGLLLFVLLILAVLDRA
jgi:Protein of unknown function (DUF3309)